MHSLLFLNRDGTLPWPNRHDVEGVTVPGRLSRCLDELEAMSRPSTAKCRS